jgi:hypothetical protein
LRRSFVIIIIIIIIIVITIIMKQLLLPPSALHSRSPLVRYDIKKSTQVPLAIPRSAADRAD